MPVVKYGAEINGYTELAVCKIDKLDSFDKIKVCVGYELDGRLLDVMPSTSELERVKPVYREMEGGNATPRASEKLPTCLKTRKNISD